MSSECRQFFCILLGYCYTSRPDHPGLSSASSSWITPRSAIWLFSGDCPGVSQVIFSNPDAFFPYIMDRSIHGCRPRMDHGVSPFSFRRSRSMTHGSTYEIVHCGSSFLPSVRLPELVSVFLTLLLSASSRMWPAAGTSPQPA